MMKLGGEDCLTAEDFLPQNSDKAAKSVSASSNKTLEDVTLYHGSRGGINGKIRPDAGRVDCDFGQGFYMGQSPEQAKGLVIESQHPVFYELKFKLSEIPQDRILVLDGNDWVNVVLANRRRSEAFNELKLAKDWLAKLENYDVIIGKIADDRMNLAMQRFTDNVLTDKGLIACLQFVNYGDQYVARTDYACSKIVEIDHRDLKGEEADAIRKYSSMKRNESRNVVDEMTAKYRRDGQFLDEIIKREKQLEKKEGYGK